MICVIPGNNEENIDADKTAGQRFRERMKQDHRQDSERASPVNIRPIICRSEVHGLSKVRSIGGFESIGQELVLLRSHC